MSNLGPTLAPTGRYSFCMSASFVPIDGMQIPCRSDSSRDWQGFCIISKVWARNWHISCIISKFGARNWHISCSFYLFLTFWGLEWPGAAGFDRIWHRNCRFAYAFNNLHMLSIHFQQHMLSTIVSQ